jgi:hypothetical protein
MNFLTLEAAYLTIAIFFLIITAFVTTRSFMPKGSFKKGMSLVGGVFLILIMLHYYNTIDRMKEIEKAFNEGKTILCENKIMLKGSIALPISKAAGWSLKDGVFSNPEYFRDFHSARCIVEVKLDKKELD